MLVQCCSDLHAVHRGGKSVASHVLCESHRDLPPLPHHDALHHLPPSLQVIILDAKYNYKNIPSRLGHALCKIQIQIHIPDWSIHTLGLGEEKRGQGWQKLRPVKMGHVR